MLGLHGGSVVSADMLAELLWGDDPPRTAVKALQTHISSLRRTLGDGFVLTKGTGWTLGITEIDATRYKTAATQGRDVIAAGDASQAVARFNEALALWRGIPELPDSPRGVSEKTRWLEGHAALVEDRADALLATGRAAEIIGELEAAIADAPLRERRWGQLMLALYRAGRQGDALGAFQRARALLADELGVDPGPDLRRLETAIVSQDDSLEMPVLQQLSVVTRAVTFLLTDIEGSTAAWESDAAAMAVALARHDEIVEQVVTSGGGRLVKTRGEGDATFSVFDRPSAAAAAAVELQEAVRHEPWALGQPMRIRIALHTGEVELRDGDYFGRAVNRAARLRSLASGGQILCSGATAELVIDTLRDDVVLADLGMRQLKNLARPEHVFELRLETVDDARTLNTDAPPVERPDLPAVLVGPGPFVGRARELERLLSAWQTTLSAGTHAVLIAGEPGVGKTRLAGEWSHQAYEQGAIVLYGRCDEDLGAPYQPFAEALRSLVPSLGSKRLRGLRGVESLLPLVPGLTDELPDLAAPARADADTERYALFDAVVALLGVASTSAPVVLILDDLHWAAKPTLLLLRHLLRFGEHARVQIVGTYRSTDLDRSHPLAAMLADLHRDGSAHRLSLGGLDEDDVTAYVSEAGYDDEELARALASVTGGNPFFLIEALRHVDESGGRWDPSTLPQGVREAVSRRLSRLPAETNKALAAAAVVGSRFALDLVERVVEEDLVDSFDDACKAGILIEEPGGRYRFNHALVRQSLLAELASVRRMRLHQRIAATLESEAGDDDELVAELAYHYFECAWAGNAAKAVEYCRRAADQAMARLAYEGAADYYDKALHALDELDDELPERDDLQAELLVARCEALLAAGDVASAAGAVAQLRSAAGDSARLAAWGTCFEGELAMLTDPERLDEIATEVAAAAAKLAALDDAAGEAKAHTVRAMCLGRLGRIAECETALDQALTAARRAQEHRRVNAVLATAPLAALWGPNPVPRAGGRCLDVVRLLRITTGSPVVEATSTRCQGVLDAFRGRAAAGRQLIESARRSLTELGMRHALLEADQFAGIVELVADEPTAAEAHLRRACNGFRRMGLDADTAETAALLARACLALDRDSEADELCCESERLAGHALKAAIAWRTVRAQLLSRRGVHAEAGRVAQEAVALAERTDALVDHGDACLALATVLLTAGDTVGGQAAAQQAVDLYELKGAAALAEKARGISGEPTVPTAPTAPEEPSVELDNTCVWVIHQTDAAFDRGAWDECDQFFAPDIAVESRRKMVRFTPADLRPGDWPRVARHLREGWAWHRSLVVAVRGERLTLTRLELGTDDASPGAPQEEFLSLWSLDEDSRIARQVFFDVDDINAAIAELDALHARFEQQRFSRLAIEPENTCVRAIRKMAASVDRDAWDEVEKMYAPDVSVESHRKIVGFTKDDLPSADWPHEVERLHGFRGLMINQLVVVAVRGDRLALLRVGVGTADLSAGSPRDESLQLCGIDTKGRITLLEWFDIDDADAAMAELDAKYAQLEAAMPRPPLENAASRVDRRFNALFAESRWDEAAALWADGVRVEDRRRGLRREVTYDHAAGVAEIRAMADLGVATMTSHVVAIRGERLALCRTQYSGRDQRPDAFHTEILRITEIDVDGRCLASVAFDLDDIDAALAELDARYLAGEAAAHAHTWSVIADAYSAVNRREMFATTPNWVNVDHRRATAFAPGDLSAFFRASWEDTPDIHVYIEAVYRLSDLAAVVVSAGRGKSREGFDAEWRDIALSTVDGDLISRTELFDETALDAALARFDELSCPATRLENAAARAGERYAECFATRDWDAMAEVLADEVVSDDRRRVVNSGVRVGRDIQIADTQAAVGVGAQWAVSEVIAIRGERLALMLISWSNDGMDTRDDVGAELLGLAEVDSSNRLSAIVSFDGDDVDAAFEELDARYLAGEAAPHAHTWSVILEMTAAFNRREIPATTPNIVSVDHRRVALFAPGELPAYLRATWDLSPQATLRIEAVHRLSDCGALVSFAGDATSTAGFSAEWRVINLYTVEGDSISRVEVFDETDLDAALARFDELGRPTPKLENLASQVNDRFDACFAARDWDALAETLTEDTLIDDRRRVVNVGTRRGRDAEVASMRAIAGIGVKNATSVVIATRGQRLALSRTRYTGRDQSPEAFQTEILDVVQIDATNQISVRVAFDPDDIDAAFDELDARYLAGEAADHAHTWSVIAETCAVLKRREAPAATPGYVVVDHRPVGTIGADNVAAHLDASLDLTPDRSMYIEAVHGLTHRGAVVTWAARDTTQQGFDAEWRIVGVQTIDGDMLNRADLFDEADLDAALARFDELSRPAPLQLANAASRVSNRCNEYFADHDWEALARLIADDIVTVDRRRVVGGLVQQGRESVIAHRRRTVNGGIRIGPEVALHDLQMAADVGFTNVTENVVAIRGDRLALTRAYYTGDVQREEAFYAEVLHILEIDSDKRIAATIVFDPDDIDAAFEELDARYLAGEASASAQTWSVITEGYAAANRGELAVTAPDVMNIDHRRIPMINSGDLIPYLRNTFDELGNIRTYLEAVHRLTDTGAVVTHIGAGASKEGFEAEWRMINVLVVDGGVIIRSEVFDEDNVDTALARFEELNRPTRRPENTASRVAERFCECFGARDWRGMGDTLAAEVCTVDNRPVVGVGKRRGRDLNVADWQAVAEVGTRNLASTVIATRGTRLVLSRFVTSGRDQRPEAFRTEVLCVIETNADKRIVACVMFETDEIDAAYKELEGRYLAGEAARYADVWSIFADTYAMFNRHEIPPLSNWVTIDHRVRETFAGEDLAAYLRSGWDVTPENKMYVECVHRLSEVGAVVTHVANGTSPEGFYAEWRMIALMTLGATSTNRCELFDEAEIATVLAKFDELSRPVPRLENTATRVYDRLLEHHAARDYDASAEILAEEYCVDDRRRVVNAGIRHGRDAAIADARTVTELGGTHITSDVIATRGERLFLARSRVSIRDEGPEVFDNESFVIVEIGADERAVAMVVFDLDDSGAAFAELDARYLADEAATHAQTWSVIAAAYAAPSWHQFPVTHPDWLTIDHRRGTPFASRDLDTVIHAVKDLTPDIRIHVEAVHRLSSVGAVVTNTSHGTSPQGFAAEWRMIQLLTVEGGRVNRCELFDEDDLDAALARFDELNASMPRLENTATRGNAQIADAFNRRDLERYFTTFDANARWEDRRKGLRSEVPMESKLARSVFLGAPASWRMEIEPVATRGCRLALSRYLIRDTDEADRPITIEVLLVTEVNDDGLFCRSVTFDPDDIDGAFVELDGRYLAGEAARYAHTWSLVAQTIAAFNRHELSQMTPNWVNIDHRRAMTSAPGDMAAYVREIWTVAPNVTTHIDAVYRLNDAGAVFSHVESGTSQHGFTAEWREVTLLTFDGDAINCCETFDEADLETALARFDELDRPAPRLENAAIRARAYVAEAYNRRDVETFLEVPAGRYQDRRKGLRDEGTMDRNYTYAVLSGTPTSWQLEVEPVAIRGDRLALSRETFRDTDDASRPITVELMTLTEVTEDEGISYTVFFDPDDVDAAFEEFESRYLAGEAAAHSHTWSVITEAYAANNRHELPSISGEFTDVDHRQGRAFAPGDLIPYIQAGWQVYPNGKTYIEAVIRLDSFGAVVVHAGHGTSHEGFEAEWRAANVFVVEDEVINRCELFDEADLDAALARFDGLRRPAHSIENAATHTWARLVDAYNRRNLDAFVARTAPEGQYHDRRKGLRDAHEGSMRWRVAQTLFDLPPSLRLETEALATRGSRLCLLRQAFRDTEDAERPIVIEFLTVLEATEEGMAHTIVNFDTDDIDSAMAELTARWIASGVVSHPKVIEAHRKIIEMTNRHEWDALTALCEGATYVNHRQLGSTTADYITSIRTAASLVPDLRIESAEFLAHSAIGVAVHVVVRGMSTEGLAIELPFVMINLLDGERVTHIENFEPDQRDLALTRFEELNTSG
ncbi:BTAD domain-containing putative transcriptional regulator [Mycolicibacterium sp. ND9-15]|nr:BTAD domain-containing putative transcriptional regulator [Mycolicibacterium sp. ND9-15]WSE58977.1 BTAD domain-containing putative transcriptional regulator [Mycolicibacterium sp. ND9-15]